MNQLRLVEDYPGGTAFVDCADHTIQLALWRDIYGKWHVRCQRCGADRFLTSLTVTKTVSS